MDLNRLKYIIEKELDAEVRDYMRHKQKKSYGMNNELSMNHTHYAFRNDST